MTNFLSRLMRRVTTLVQLSRREKDVADEMRFHLDMEARELTRLGMSPITAEREARLRFGGLSQQRDKAREALGVRMITDLAQDLRYAVRVSLQHPTFTIVTLTTLGLSVGAATFMYSFATMSPVPFVHADRLVYLRQFSKTSCPNCQLVSSGNALAFAASSRTLASIAFVSGPSAAALRRGDRSMVVHTAAVTYAFLNVVRVRPILGRGFLPSDSLPGAPSTALIAEPLWRTAFGADSSIVGRDIVLDGRHVTVRGIVSRDDIYPERTDVWTIQTLGASEMNDHASNLNYLTIGRLHDGTTLDEVVAEAATVSARLAHDYPSDFREWQLDVRPLARYGRGSEDDKVIFSVAAGFVLIIACVNLAGLLIARLTRRRRELAVRAAMGAHAERLTRQLLTESVLVCSTSGLLGIGAADAGIKGLIRIVPESIAPPGFTRFAIDGRAFLFALALATACGVVVALWPAFRFARPSLNNELRDGARSRSARGASGGERLRGALVVVELALSTVMLSAAGLLVRSQANLTAAPVGMATDHVLTVSVQLPAEVDGKRVESRGYFDRLASEISRVPGVAAAGAVAFLPLSNSGWSSSAFQVEGRPPLQRSGGTRAQIVTPGYFVALRIPIVRGRAFSNADADTARRVAIVNETLVRRFFPDGDVLGRTLVLANGARLEVVGVVADVKQQGPMFDPGQEILTPAALSSRRSMTMVFRTIGDPAAAASDVIRGIAAFDPNLAINRVRTMDAVVDEFMAAPRVGLMAMIVFAAIALLIATSGLYAIMSFTVESRTRELGVRLALGATDRSLLWLVLEQGARLAALGTTIGVGLALVVIRAMQSKLFEVTSNDPRTLGAVTLGVVAVALLAGLVPARRALGVDPVMSLRAE